MVKGGHGQANQLHDINWGVLNHVSHVGVFMCMADVVCLPNSI